MQVALATSPPALIVEAARQASLNSPCLSKRGAAVWDPAEATLVSVGWNDMPSGLTCTSDDACKAQCRHYATHAECMAILASVRPLPRSSEMLHVKTIDGRTVPSGPPSCALCSHVILSSGIAAMWLLHEDGWRRYDAIEFHKLTIAAELGVRRAASR